MMAGSTVTHVSFAPMVGFRFEGGSIDLGSGVEIGPVTEEELGRAEFWLSGLYRATHVVRVFREMNRAELEDRSTTTVDRAAYSTILHVLSGIRLFKRGQFGAAMVLGYVPSGAATGMSPSDESVPVVPVGYGLTAAEGDEFRAFWKEHRAAFSGRLEYALSSFSLGCSRGYDEKALLDLTIAAEALFLGDVNDELKYRAALRAAFFVADNPAERERVYDSVRDVYDVRSWIVHGKSRKAPTSLTRDASKPPNVALALMVSAFQDTMRLALREATKLVSAGAWPPRWERLILGVDDTDA